MDNKTLFYIIEIRNKQNQKGFILTDYTKKNPYVISLDKPTGDIMQFTHYSEAQNFLREHKIEKNGVRAYIKDNQDMIKENMGDPITKEMFFIENVHGERIAPAPNGQVGYVFQNIAVGFCVWPTEVEADEFMDYYNIKNAKVKPLKPKQKPNVSIPG